METNELQMQAEENGWREALPEQLREAPYIKNADSLDQVLADLTNAAAWQGNSLRIPGPDADADAIKGFEDKALEKYQNFMLKPNTDDPDVMAQVFAKLGKPEAADAYRTPDDLKMTAEEIGEWKSIAFDADMTQAQIATTLGKLNTKRENAAVQAQQALDTDITALKGEWGMAYDQNREAVGALLKTTGTPPEIIDAWEKGTLPANQMRWLNSLSQLSGEGNTFSQQTDGQARIMAPAEALEQLAEVETRLFAKDMRPSDPMYKVLNDKRIKLVGLAYPE